MKATLLYSYYQMESLWKMIGAMILFLTAFVWFMIEKTQSYEVLLGLSVQIPCIFTLITAQRRLKQHEDQWDKYCLILPLSRGKMVQSEFLLFFGMTVISLVFMLILVSTSFIKGYFISKSDLGILFGLPVFVSMVSQVLLFLFSNHGKDLHTELFTVVSVYITVVLLGLPYLMYKDFLFAQYEENGYFGVYIALVLWFVSGIITTIAYKISLKIMNKREY